MVLSWKLCSVLLLTLVQIHFPHLLNGEWDEFPIASLSTSWTNSPLFDSHSMYFTDGSRVREILLRGSSAPRIACGFYCNGNCDTYLFAIFIQTYMAVLSSYPPQAYPEPQVVWSANRDHLVRINATLQLTSEGDLVLLDVDGTIAWSTNTGGMSVAGLNLTERGNLVLFDVNNKTVWQSFDHPTDSLLLGQKLVLGQKLTASVSASNWTQGGMYSLSATSNGEGLVAFIESNPPQAYYGSIGKQSKEPSYVKFLNGSLATFGPEADPISAIPVPLAASVQYMRLEPDGHLRVYEWEGEIWREVGDLLTWLIGSCGYPMVCGEYGICSNRQCSCPESQNGTSYLNQINNRKPDLGCSRTTPLTCRDSQYHSFLELKDITYFTIRSDPTDVVVKSYEQDITYFDPRADLTDIDMKSCKQACLKNCSCKAALFQYGWNSSAGNCYLLSQIFSLINIEGETSDYNSSAFVKVQIGPSSDNSPTPVPLKKKTGRVAIVLLSSLGTFFGLFIVISILVFILWKKRDANEAKEDYLYDVPGMPTRFSYEELKARTENFSKKLGEGGFGSVFQGTLSNGTKVAVKQLEGVAQIKKSFLAEVETIGTIHHINLVRLIGFCAEKFHRLLVYEYMCNGSLDKWIFHKNHELALDWQRRQKIILNIAKGLAYLHEECRQKIVHLDIKPQNILLDEGFNAKVSDFGLAKLIDRDQSQVMTTMRGTIGYLAPEWLSSVITEKVDVYSYGVVVLEILCGRKNLDRSQLEEHMHLLSLLKKKAEEGQLLDMVDKYSEDMQSHGAEAVQMMRLAMWCLQSDFARRPFMSMVVKVLEGSVDVEDNLDYNFTNPPSSITLTEVGHMEVSFGDATPLLPSVLSGPR